MAMPDMSPLVAPNLVCRSCGDTLEPKPIKGPRGQILHIEYQCLNEKHDPYKLETTEMSCSGMKPLRKDGTAVQV